MSKALKFIDNKSTILNVNDSSNNYVYSLDESEYKWIKKNFTIHKLYSYKLNDITDNPIPSYQNEHYYYKEDCVTYNNRYYICIKTHKSMTTSTYDVIPSDVVDNALNSYYWYDYTDKLSNIINGDYTIQCHKFVNLIKYSEKLKESVWVPTNVSVNLEYNNSDIITPIINGCKSYHIILPSNHVSSIYSFAQHFNARQSKKYKFSMYIKNIDTLVKNVALTFMTSTYGCSVIFNIQDGTFVAQKILDSNYEEYTGTQTLFSNINYEIEAKDSNVYRLTLIADILSDKYVSAELNFLNNTSYKWATTSGVYKSYMDCFQLIECRTTANNDAPTYLATTDKSITTYNDSEIYLKSASGNTLTDISLHIFDDEPTKTSSVKENDIATLNGIIGITPCILGNYDPYPTIITNEAYGVYNTTEIPYVFYGLGSESTPTEERKIYVHPNKKIIKQEESEYLYYDTTSNLYYFKDRDGNYKVIKNDVLNIENTNKDILNALLYNTSLYTFNNTTKMYNRLIHCQSFNNR